MLAGWVGFSEIEDKWGRAKQFAETPGSQKQPAPFISKKNGKRFKTVELIVEQTEWSPPPLRYDPDILVPIRIEASNVSLPAKVKAAGGKWFPEKLLWYVKYSAIVGSPLEKHIHVDNSENTLKR